MCCRDTRPLTAEEVADELAFWRGYVQSGRLTGEQAYQLARVCYRYGFRGIQLPPPSCCL